MAQFRLRSPIQFIAGDTIPERVDLDEKATTKAKDPFEQYGISMKAEGELDIADYRDMMQRDSQVKAAISLKILARLSSGYDIVPASGEDIDVEVADFIRDQLAEMRGTFSGFLRRAMMSMAYGMTVHEIVLKVIEDGPWRGKIGLKALKWKHPENFRVKTDDYGNVEALEQKVDNEWEPLPPEYFVVWCWDHEGDFKSRSDLRPAYRWFKAKDLVDRIWNVHLEKYATPTPIGKYPKGASVSAQREMMEALRQMHSTKAIVAPQAWEVELLEAQRRGDAGYEGKIKYCDRMIARAILLPTLLLDEGESGAYALGQQHADNFTWVLDALGEECAEEIIEEQLIRPLVAYNFNVEAFPKFEWRPYQGVDLEKMAEALERLVNAKVVDPSEDWIREKLDLPPLDEDVADPDDDGDEPAQAEPGSGEDGPDDGAATPTEGEESDEAVMSARLELRSAAHQKFDAVAVRDRLNDLQDTAVTEMTAATQAMLSGLKKQIRSRKLLENRDYVGVDKLTLPAVGDFRRALDVMLASAVMWGASDALDELRRGAEKTGEQMPELPETMGINLSDVLFEVEEPVEFATTRKEVVDSFKGKVPIQRAALAQYGRESYTITGVYRDDLLAGSKRIVQKGIRRGASYKQIESELDAFFRPYMEAPGAIDPGVAEPYRLHNIARTNLSEAYSVGRMNLFNAPSVGDFVQAYEYSSVIDDRTTDICREWDGVVLLKGSPEWGQMVPPNHFQCRGVLIPITKGEKFKVSNVPSARPAEGFAFTCGCGGAA